MDDLPIATATTITIATSASPPIAISMIVFLLSFRVPAPVMLEPNEAIGSNSESCGETSRAGALVSRASMGTAPESAW